MLKYLIYKDITVESPATPDVVILKYGGSGENIISSRSLEESSSANTSFKHSDRNITLLTTFAARKLKSRMSSGSSVLILQSVITPPSSNLQTSHYIVYKLQPVPHLIV